MYTSGTTGKPKGIVFSHENIVSKRLLPRASRCREVNEGDVFLAYLPLYHTFGRWLELTGTLFWGATYVFARSTAQSTAARGLQAGEADGLHLGAEEVDGAARGRGLGGGLRR